MTDSTPEEPTTTTKPDRRNPYRRGVNPRRQQPPESSSPLTHEERRAAIANNASLILLHPQVTLTCYIPTACVGAVIGRRGSTVALIQKHAQQYINSSSSNNTIRVSIVGENETDVPYTYSPLDWSDSTYTPVVIRAEPAAALAAAEKLEQVVVQELENLALAQQQPTMDEVVLDISLSRTKHASLVGKKGWNVMTLSADTNTRIMVPRRDIRHDVIQLEGDLENVTQCFHLVLLSLVGLENRKKKQPNTAADTTTTTTIKLPVSSCPPTTKLKSISTKTDTIIEKIKATDDDKHNTTSSSYWGLLIISGEQAATAAEMLSKWNVNNNNEKETNSSRKRTKRGRGRRTRASTGDSGNKATSGGEGEQNETGESSSTPRATETTTMSTEPGSA